MADNSSIIKKLALGIGATAILTSGAVLFTKLFHDSFMNEIRALRWKIKSGWIRNPVLEPLKMSSEMTLFLNKSQNIQFYVKIVPSSKFGNPQKIDPSEADPTLDHFAKENCEPIFIDNLSETHSLLYNKFHLVPYHVLIVTKEFVKQNIALDESDFFASLKVMKTLRGLIFFNSGPKSGASQEHKHLQAIPYSSYPNHSIPIDVLIENYLAEEDSQYFTLPQFHFQHIFCRFNPSITSVYSKKDIKNNSRIMEKV